MAGTMTGDRTAALLALLLLLSSLSPTVGYRGGREEEVMPGGGGEENGGKGLFILGNSKRVVKTEGGQVRVVTGYRWKGDQTPMHIGFIHMEPNTLFIPQYIDSDLTLFVRRGKVRVGWIHGDKMVKSHLKPGDISTIPAGSTFYIVNAARDERLQIICSIDASESLGYNSYQSFFIGGGKYPRPVLAGFDLRTLAVAFNVTMKELRPMMKRQSGGPIIYLGDAAAVLSGVEEEEEEEEEEEGRAWSWRKLFDYLVGRSDDDSGSKGGRIRTPDSYNLFDRKPSFQNDYGWTIAIDDHDYAPLERSGTGVYLVNLTAGSMLAPHVNPTATEYGIVLGGSGTIQVVFPNGSAAMNAEVAEGDVFWIPRYFPFCQVASLSGPMEFFGFTTSSRRNRPQFLAGASSVLRSMRGAELAAGFGVSEESLRRMVEAQKESVILPAWPRPEEKGKVPPLLIKRGVMVA